MTSTAIIFREPFETDTARNNLSTRADEALLCPNIFVDRPHHLVGG